MLHIQQKCKKVAGGFQDLKILKEHKKINTYYMDQDEKFGF
jgi:hypothetical protein